MPKLTQSDFERFEESRHFDSYRILGAHATPDGTWFAAWAPFAEHIAVMGEFNSWDPSAHPMVKVGTGYSGLWECFVPGAHDGHHYKYRVYRGRHVLDKTDPYAFRLEAPLTDGNPVAGLSSIITDLSHEWGDQAWMDSRQGPGSLKQPVAIYEVHLGSWTKREDGYSLTYREIAEPLANHVAKMGFTHVELLPVMEHPYYPSWGYQVVGYYAPTYRYGSPQDLMYLIDYLHQRGIGVLLDWVPAHFAADPQGLVFFDGSTLYECDDPLMRYHPDWGTYVFDYKKSGVRNFLISNARFWLEHYHIDGLRFDAVASMLYRDYSRQEWRPNRYGGRENLEAIEFLQQVNEAVYADYPDVMMVAEESTAWPKVTEPTYNGGLGFLYKWNMGWMHDTLAYLSLDPIHREHHHEKLTFSLWYSFSEHYMLPLSHDEVVHMKGSLWGKMGGSDPWQKAANLRLLYGHMVGHPGKKLLFMGSEFGQEREWNHDAPLDWVLLDDPLHAGIRTWLQDLLTLYRTHPALWDDGPNGFNWIDLHNRSMCVLGYLRKNEGRQLIFMFNFTPVPRHNYMLGVPEAGTWREVLNSDAPAYGGSGAGNTGWVETVEEGHHGYAQSLSLSLPPLGVLVLEREDRPSETPKAKSVAKKKTTPKPKAKARKKAAPKTGAAAGKKVVSRGKK